MQGNYPKQNRNQKIHDAVVDNVMEDWLAPHDPSAVIDAAQNIASNISYQVIEKYGLNAYAECTAYTDKLQKKYGYSLQIHPHERWNREETQQWQLLDDKYSECRKKRDAFIEKQAVALQITNEQDRLGIHRALNATSPCASTANEIIAARN